MPTVLAQRVAARIAPVITDLARGTYGGQRNVYGDAWRERVDGSDATLVATGALKSKVKFAAVGTLIRVVLGTRYAKYQIGMRRILPAPSAPLPTEWSARIEREAQDEIRKELKS